MIRILGILFLILYMGYMYFIGGAFTNKQGSYATQFFIGYMIFSACVAVGGIIIQVLNLSWWIFVLYLAAVFGGLGFVAIGMMATNHIPIIRPNKIRDFFSSQWFMLVIALFLTILSVSHLLWIWGNNASDDGYYLSLVGTLPYSPNTFHTAPSTGFPTTLQGMGSYIINTIYTEYSVYSFFTGIKAPLFCRIYMSFFNYFLFNASIVALAEKVFQQTKMQIKENMLQYACAIMLLFGFTMGFMNAYNILHVYDNWQFNTAMYYGSSIVRCMSILWVLVPFFSSDRVELRHILYVAGIAVALLSKSTIALPLMIIVPTAYLFVFWIMSKNPSNYVLAALLAIGYLTVSIFLGNQDSMQERVMEYFAYVKTSILLIPCLIPFIGSFLTRNKYIIRYNITLLVILALMVLNPINNLFEVSCVIGFVGARALACFAYTFVLTCFIYTLMGVYYIARVDSLRKGLVLTVSGLLVVYLPLSDNTNYAEFFSKFVILHQNPDCMPASTSALGEVMEERYHETGQMNIVAMIQESRPNGMLHDIAASIRCVTPHTISLSAVPRFGADQSGEYQSYTKDVQNSFNYFIGNPVDDTYNVLYNDLDLVRCNMIITNSETGLTGVNYAPFLARSGFELYRVIEDPDANIQYFVYTRNI